MIGYPKKKGYFLQGKKRFYFLIVTLIAFYFGYSVLRYSSACVREFGTTVMGIMFFF